MKKFIVAVAAALCMGNIMTFANNTSDNLSQIVAAVDDFTPIKAEELPQAVKDAIQKAYPQSTIKEAAEERSETGALYKVTLETADGQTVIVVYTDKGEIQQ